MTGMMARCSGGVLGGCISFDPGYSCLRAWRATRGGEGDGIGGDGGLSTFCLATGVFGALLWPSFLAAQPAVYGIVSGVMRRPTPSFRLLRTGCWKARCVALCARLRTGVLTSDWRFRRHPAAQLFSSAASCLRHRVWRDEKADAELSFAANRLLEGEMCVFVW